MARLGSTNYGKQRVRLVRVTRGADRHELVDYTVGIRCFGPFTAAHVGGDNAAVLPTDTMKNTVFAFAKEHAAAPPEVFALRLARHFREANPAAEAVEVAIAQHGWGRIHAGGAAHPHAFLRKGGGTRAAQVHVGQGGAAAISAGVEGLEVLKTTGSGFEGFLRDRYTTLKETSDRIFATSVTASWRYAGESVQFDAAWEKARDALLVTFAGHDSRSVQHTLYAMGEAALAAVPEMVRISLSMPNRHHLLVDLSPFGLANANEVFVATEEPHGLIEATLRRDA